MASILQRKEVQKALEDAKRIAAQPLPPQEHTENTYHDGMARAAQLKEMLVPSWFIKDIDTPVLKKKQQFATTKKRRSKKSRRSSPGTTTHSRRR